MEKKTVKGGLGKAPEFKAKANKKSPQGAQNKSWDKAYNKNQNGGWDKGCLRGAWSSPVWPNVVAGVGCDCNRGVSCYCNRGLVSYVYSVTIRGLNSSIAFLKACPNLLEVNGKVLAPGQTEVILKNNEETETISLIRIVEGKNFEEIYKQYKELTKEFGLSLEYLKEGKIWLLAKNQLRSQEKIQEKIEHRIIRKKKYKHQDLELRKAKDSDYGKYCEIGIFEVFRNSISWKERLRSKIKQNGIFGYLEVVNEFDESKKFGTALWYNIVEKGKVRTIGKIGVENWAEANELWKRGIISRREERELNWLWEKVQDWIED